MSHATRYISGDLRGSISTVVLNKIKALADLIKSGKVAKKDFVIVDVRDDDYAGGNIKGSINIPSREFLRNVDGLVMDTKEVPLKDLGADVKPLKSGPKAARIYSETRKNTLAEHPPNDVAILQDGFSQFQIKYRDDAELVENWDKDVWADAVDWS